MNAPRVSSTGFTRLERGLAQHDEMLADLNSVSTCKHSRSARRQARALLKNIVRAQVQLALISSESGLAKLEYIGIGLIVFTLAAVIASVFGLTTEAQAEVTHLFNAGGTGS